MSITPWDGAGSLYGVAMRVGRLDATGAPAVGANGMYVTDAFTKVDLEPVYLEGQSIEQRKADGGLCLSYEGDEAFRHFNVTIEICTPDPQLAEILGGGTVLTADDEVVGYAAPDVGATPHPNGLSIEVFSRAVLDGGAAPTNPFIQHVFSRVRKLRRTDTSTIGPENALLGTYQGIAVGNANFGDGPAHDWELAGTKPYQYARVATAPTPVLGYQAIVSGE